MTQIVAPIFENVEEFLEENLTDFFEDNVCAIQRKTLWFEDFSATFMDVEEDTEKTLELSDFVKALSLLVKEISNKRLFVGGIENPADLTDPCNWDAEVVDAFFQLAYHGDVIYG